jgi:hypothetical protein
MLFSRDNDPMTPFPTSRASVPQLALAIPEKDHFRMTGGVELESIYELPLNDAVVRLVVQVLLRSENVRELLGDAPLLQIQPYYCRYELRAIVVPDDEPDDPVLDDDQGKQHQGFILSDVVLQYLSKGLAAVHVNHGQ